MDLFYFWELTPKQFNKHLEAYIENREQELKLDMQVKDQLNYYLGQYISVGVNNPKKYPKVPFLEKSNKPKETNNDYLSQKGISWVLQMGGNVVYKDKDGNVIDKDNL